MLPPRSEGLTPDDSSPEFLPLEMVHVAMAFPVMCIWCLPHLDSKQQEAQCASSPPLGQISWFDVKTRKNAKPGKQETENTHAEVYNSLLDGCGRQQKPQKAMEYLKDMIRALAPTAKTAQTFPANCRCLFLFCCWVVF